MSDGSDMPRLVFSILFCMAVTSAVVLSPAGPVIALILSLSGIGIPFALLLMAIPTLFLFVFIASVVGALFGGRGWWSYGVGTIVSILVLTSIPYLANTDLERQVRSFAGGDVNALDGGKIRRLAIILPKQRYTSAPLCGGLCQRILLNGNVEELIIAETEQPNWQNVEINGTLHRRYKADRCPVHKFVVGGLDFSPPGERRRREDKSPADLLALQMMAGNCIAKSPARVDTADAIVLQERGRSRSADAPADWDLWSWNIRHGALVALQRREGKLAVTYRHTIIHSDPLFPVLSPTITRMAFNGFGRNATGFLRWAKTTGAESQYLDAPDIGAFLADRLGFDLSLHYDRTAEQTLELASRALKPGRAEYEGTAAAVQILFTGVAHNRSAPVAELDMAARLLGDAGVLLPENVALATKRILERRPEHADALASGLFARFASLSRASGHSKDDKVQLYRCAQAIGSLPPNAVQPYFPVVERVARDPQLRGHAGPLLRHLSSFGSRGVPLALFLIEESWRFRKPDRPVTNAWQAAYLPGLTALCRLGPDASAAMSKLQALRAANLIASHGSYERLWKETLQRLGGAEIKGQFACGF